MRRKLSETPVSRRCFLGGTAGLAATVMAPAVIARDRPAILDGVQSGDVTGSSAVVWSRCDRPARLIVEWDTAEAFRNPRKVAGTLASPATGLTATAELNGLPAGQTVFWRAAFEDADRPGLLGGPEAGRLRIPAAEGGRVSFLFGGDQNGAWGIDPDRGGMRLFETMLRAGPDFLVHLGDRIYADAVFHEDVVLPDGRRWRNLVTPAKTRPAQTAAEYRGNYAYNFLDGPYRRFAAAVPQLCTWDDHEVTNDWWPGGTPRKKKYSVDMATLFANGRQAFFDYTPMRRDPARPDRLYRSVRYGPLVEVFMLDTHSYRAPNRRPEEALDADPMLGAEQVTWLKAALARSTALWKMIGSSVPIEVQVPGVPRQDKWADGNAGAPRGREAELADILSFIRARGIRNTVWLAADVHYGAAIEFHPDRAAWRDFDPFWEFIAGPFHTSTGRLYDMDPTFGPDRVFATVAKDAAGRSTPFDEMVWYGQGDIDGASGALTVTIRDIVGRALYTHVLEPRG